MHEISQKELEASIATVTLVEALPEKHWRSGHLPGARNLPLAELPARAAEVLPDRDADIVVYCSDTSCQNSHVAWRKLVDLGYSRVRVFTGGKRAWTEAGQPLAVTS
jgi:rhodanese-related sulfurtransferase